MNFITYEQEGFVGVITINRPKALNALNSEVLKELNATLLGNKPYITGCGGLDELYAVMRGESFQDIAEQCGGIVSVTYSPAMIQTAIQDMVDHLDGEEVEQDHVIACEIVNSDNVKDYPSF